MIVTVHFDGLCEPNPGGVATYGWAVRGVPGSGDPPHVGCGRVEFPGVTNNDAEYAALGKALAFIKAHLAVQRADQLMIHGDSKLVIEQINGRWQCNGPRLRKLRARCLELLAEIGCGWSAVWIGREHNTAADALSRAAFVGITGEPVPERPKKSKGAQP